MIDPYFCVKVVAKTPNPQQVVWTAMHQCYYEGFAADDTLPSEDNAGNIIIKCLLAGDRGHYGPLQEPQITFNVGGFGHSVMQQARTHRIGVSFCVQSGRYTGKRVTDIVEGIRTVEEVFYLRPVGEYRDRQGKKYEYTEELRREDIELCALAAKHYSKRIAYGMAEEHARSMLPFDIRQNFVVSFNLRSLLHFFDLRFRKDAQLEIQQMCALTLPHLEEWAPELAAWYIKNRLGKGKLAP
jgi:thymidylate synthase (FAD)